MADDSVTDTFVAIADAQVFELGNDARRRVGLVVGQLRVTMEPASQVAAKASYDQASLR